MKQERHANCTPAWQTCLTPRISGEPRGGGGGSGSMLPRHIWMLQVAGVYFEHFLPEICRYKKRQKRWVAPPWLTTARWHADNDTRTWKTRIEVWTLDICRFWLCSSGMFLCGLFIRLLSIGLRCFCSVYSYFMCDVLGRFWARRNYCWYLRS